MTLRLILTRHAKSSWDDPRLQDHERPLNARGRRSAELLGHWLASRGDLPDEVLCSDSRRTIETWERIGPHLDGRASLRQLPELYLAGPDAMLSALRRARGRVVMMLGHNPGIAEFARLILARAPAHPDFGRYPTGGTLVATFEGDAWGDVGFGQGSAVDFVTPRALEA
ncbi:MAG: SixA phosphatase family protein [Gemmobacter sp.]